MHRNPRLGTRGSPLAMIQARNEGKDYFAEGPDILAKAGVATGAAKPFAMTDDEMAAAPPGFFSAQPSTASPTRLAPWSTPTIRAFGVEPAFTGASGVPP